MGLVIFVLACAIAASVGYVAYRKVRKTQMEGYVDGPTEEK